MDAEKYWSTADLNKFVYRQTKALCEANGFVLNPRRTKTLVRIKGHLITNSTPGNFIFTHRNSFWRISHDFFYRCYFCR